jgi:hypothetical protein
VILKTQISGGYGKGVGLAWAVFRHFLSQHAEENSRFCGQKLSYPRSFSGISGVIIKAGPVDIPDGSVIRPCLVFVRESFA